MELKVWCDGIQRVVCGVNSGTTCQDVVFALAHATAQTGRFILIEKWRNSERLLAPSEHPLQVLSKWGEYANDVTFVMRRSENYSKSNANANLNLSLSPQLSSPSNSSSLATSPQHMLTTASGGGISSPNRRDFLNLFNTNNSIYSSVNKKSSVFLQNSGCSPSMTKQMTSNTINPNSSSNTTPNASPLKSNSCLNSSHNNSNSNNKTAIDSIGNDLMSNKQQMNNKNNNSIELTPTKSTAICGNRPRHPPPYSEAICKSTLISSGGQTNNSSSSHLLSPTDTTCATNKRRSAEPSPQSQKQRTGGSQKELLLHRDAVRLVDMQKETMRTQEKEMSSLEQQIGSIEKRLIENELLIKRYKDEMEVCHQLWLDQEVMIDQLGDQQRLEQELDQLVDNAESCEEEMVSLKKKLSKCEADIGDCRQQITKLMDQLEDNERLVRDKAINKEEKEREMSEQLRVALRDKNVEFESQKSELQTLTNSIKHLDSVLSEKTSEMDRLLSEIKEANIQGLALQSADEKQKLCSNSGQPFHQRSGSTRRIIGSPRQLENAVATNKNPHGVWV